MSTAPERVISPLSTITDAEIDDHFRDCEHDPRQQARYLSGLMATNPRLGLRLLSEARNEALQQTASDEAFMHGALLVVDTLRRSLGKQAFDTLMTSVIEDSTIVTESAAEQVA